jgi:hypothetical protein
LSGQPRRNNGAARLFKLMDVFNILAAAFQRRDGDTVPGLKQPAYLEMRTRFGGVRDVWYKVEDVHER